MSPVGLGHVAFGGSCSIAEKQVVPSSAECSAAMLGMHLAHYKLEPMHQDK